MGRINEFIVFFTQIEKEKADFFSRSAAADLEKNNANNVGLKIELGVISKESPLPPCQGGVAPMRIQKYIWRRIVSKFQFEKCWIT